MTWTPVDLEMEVPPEAWARFLNEIQVWNVTRFGQRKPIWIDLTEDEASEALAHFGFRPLVRCIFQGEQTMSFHLATRRIVEKDQGDSFLRDLINVRVREEQMAVTISSPTGVRFALCGGLPGPVLRVAQDALSTAREAANRTIRRAVTGDNP